MTPRILVILAGGGGRRMGGQDKGLLEWGGQRFIDIIIERARAQNPLRFDLEILISGPHDYGLGLPYIADNPAYMGGPVGGLFSVSDTIACRHPDPSGFFTVPVDGPRFPENLFARLYAQAHSTIAADDTGLHPVYGWWRQADLAALRASADMKRSLSLHGLVAQSRAKPCHWSGSERFLNVNDAARLEALRETVGDWPRGQPESRRK